jgi:uncharacterized protein (TIGR03437 family)
MLKERFLKLLLVVLSLAVWAGTANATSPTNFYASTMVNSVLTPLNPATTPLQLIYVVNGGTIGNQVLATQLVTISLVGGSPDPSSFTISQAGWPNWLVPPTLAQTPDPVGITNGSPQVLQFQVKVAGLPVPTSYPATYSYTVQLQQSGYADMPLVFQLVLCNSPLSVNTSALIPFTAVGTNLGNPQSINMGLVGAGGNGQTWTDPVTFTLDANTVPSWLDPSDVPATRGIASATPANQDVYTFTLDPNVTPAMSPGIYTASVGFLVTGFGEYFVPFTLTVSNAAPTLLLQEGIDGTILNKTWSAGMSIPMPSVTPYSSNEPIPFTVQCSITLSVDGTTPNCTPSVTSGMAYSWGSTVNVPGLLKTYFNNVPLGNNVTVTITITPAVGANPVPIAITYIYTLTPIPAVVVSSNPSAVAQATGYSTVVLLQGTGFVSSTNIKPNSGLVPTQVWLGAAKAASNTVAVLSSTLISLSIPSNAMPAIPTGSTSTTLAIGVANYNGSAPSAPTSSYNLTITTAPVVYGLTSTATYMQPAAGSAANVAAYELISIFGANLMDATITAGVSETLDSYNKVPTTLTISGNGASAVTMQVQFTVVSGKTTTNYLAPILFANQTQINCIVPSGMTVGATASMTVTTAGSTTVPLTVNVVTAEPGVFTMASDGIGPGAILNIASGGGTTVNGSTNPAASGDTLSIYVTGLGAPDSTAADNASNKSTLFPSACVAISNSAKATPGYLQVVNTSAAGYTSPKWTTIDGAVITYSPNALLLPLLPPCMESPVTVVIGTAPNTLTLSGNSIGYAGFVAGSVAGLYQVNATLPTTLNWSNGTPIGTTATYPIQVTIGGVTSPATATVQF